MKAYPFDLDCDLSILLTMFIPEMPVWLDIPVVHIRTKPVIINDGTYWKAMDHSGPHGDINPKISMEVAALLHHTHTELAHQAPDLQIYRAQI